MNADLAAPTQLREETAAWFAGLRTRLCDSFTALKDTSTTPLHHLPAGRFTYKDWQRAEGGGGTMAMMHGRVFEKVGVNISTVWGSLSEEFRPRLAGTESSPAFWASGVSLVAHMQSPLVPAAHFNTRLISTAGAFWFGGGGDLNPMYPDAEDTAAFHSAFKAACDAFDPTYYETFKAWCDKYFMIRHRGVARGEGGIFFDSLNSGDPERDFAFTRAVGEAFLSAYIPIILKNITTPWTEEQRRHQLKKRGWYAEFNLLYDRGTEFGLKTGGNVEAILMSLPPLAAWP